MPSHRKSLLEKGFVTETLVNKALFGFLLRRSSSFYPGTKKRLTGGVIRFADPPYETRPHGMIHYRFAMFIMLGVKVAKRPATPPSGGIAGEIPPKGGTPARSPVRFAPKPGEPESLSRIESQDDIQVSTLQRLVRALGGELEIIAHFPAEMYELDSLRNRRKGRRKGERLTVQTNATDQVDRLGRVRRRNETTTNLRSA